MYYKCSICQKSLKPNQVTKLIKQVNSKYSVVLPYHFCRECYKIFEERIKESINPEISKQVADFPRFKERN